MKRPILLSMAAILALFPVWSQGADEADRGSERAYTEKFGVITQRNIFLRNRSRPRSENDGPRRDPRPAPRKAEQALILTGIVQEDERLIAFIENVDTGATHRVGLGEAIAAGKITAMAFDAAEFEMAGKRIRVEVGHNLEGGVAEAPTISATTQGTSSPSDAAVAAIEAKLKQKRQQENGKGPVAPSGRPQ
jgi:hypothetical protein